MHFLIPASKFFSEKNFLCFLLKKPPMEKFLIFSLKKVFFIFWETELSRPKIKKILIFREMELSSPKLKTILIFQERTCKTWKTNISYVSYVSGSLLVFHV